MVMVVRMMMITICLPHHKFSAAWMIWWLRGIFWFFLFLFLVFWEVICSPRGRLYPRELGYVCLWLLQRFQFVPQTARQSDTTAYSILSCLADLGTISSSSIGCMQSFSILIGIYRILQNNRSAFTLYGSRTGYLKAKVMLVDVLNTSILQCLLFLPQPGRSYIDTEDCYWRSRETGESRPWRNRHWVKDFLRHYPKTSQGGQPSIDGSILVMTLHIKDLPWCG